MFETLTYVVRKEAEEIAEYAGGLLLYILLLAVFTVPLHPLEFLPMTAVAIYGTLKIRKSVLLFTIVASYMVLSFISIPVGLIMLVFFTLLLTVFVKKYSLALGAVALSTISYYMLEYSMNIYEYVDALFSYMSGVGYDVIGIHLALLPILLIYAIMYIPFLRSTRVGGYIASNPTAYPVIQFMTLLICVAVLLAMGREALANRYVEIAYYSLVVGVIMMLKDVLMGKKALKSLAGKG